MNKSEYVSVDQFHKALTLRLSRASQALQKIEQRMTLVNHRSQEIVFSMKKIREHQLMPLIKPRAQHASKN